jgi:hypothetical protein
VATEKFLLVCVREKGIERGALASWLSFSAAAGEREREREHRRGLGWAPASSPAKSAVLS